MAYLYRETSMTSRKHLFVIILPAATAANDVTEIPSSPCLHAGAQAEPESRTA